MAAREKQPLLNIYSAAGKEAAAKKAEILLSAHIAVHSSIKTIDHLSEMVKSLGSKSTLEDIKLHRTKASMIIKNVIGKTLKEELKKAMEGRKFSLMIDESTDISTKKLLAVCVRTDNACFVFIMLFCEE